ncbi:MAG: ClbS/DfsB family four-helix bundle protein [Anaerolineales bacterium]|jgi:hypothetical protein
MASMSGNYASPPKDKVELMARVGREWKELMEAISGLSERKMTVAGKGRWSIKDNLAHLAAWERFLQMHILRNLPAHEVMGIDEAGFHALDENGINAILYQRNKDRPVDQVLAELHDTHRQVVEDLGRMSFEEMMSPRATDPQHRPLMGWITGNTYEHYREHRESIERMASG